LPSAIRHLHSTSLPPLLLAHFGRVADAPDAIPRLYGEFGHEFAEAHHIIPLSRLKGPVMTTVDDLITVCANCHRMLHQMDGKSGDIPRLRSIVRRHRKRQ
jgi:predicted HNH restriction endonuclease